MDSGCSNHMAKDQSIFKDIDKSVNVKVRLGNGTTVESQGKGTNIAMKAEVDDSWLWHRRFDHFNTYALKLLYKKNLMRDLPCLKENNESCEGCLLGKQQ